MNALEFESRLAGEDRIKIPAEIVGQVPVNSRLRVILMWGDEEQGAWQELAMNGLASAYAPEDSVYEQLADESPTR